MREKKDNKETLEENMLAKTNIEKTLRNIMLHKCNKKNIASQDRPLERLVGFMCKGCKEDWTISLSELKNLPDCLSVIIEKKIFKTQKNRKLLAKILDVN